MEEIPGRRRQTEGESIGRVQAIRRRHQRRVDLERLVVAPDVVDLHRGVGRRRRLRERDRMDLRRGRRVRAERREIHARGRRDAPIRRAARGQARVHRERIAVEVPVIEGRDLLADRRGEEGAEPQRRDARIQVLVRVVIGHDHVVDALAAELHHAIGVAHARVRRGDPVHVEIGRDEVRGVDHRRDLRGDVGRGSRPSRSPGSPAPS